MRNPALEPLEELVGTWELTLTNAWFLESMDVEQHGRAVVRWLGDAFVELRRRVHRDPAQRDLRTPVSRFRWTDTSGR